MKKNRPQSFGAALCLAVLAGLLSLAASMQARAEKINLDEREMAKKWGLSVPSRDPKPLEDDPEQYGKALQAGQERVTRTWIVVAGAGAIIMIGCYCVVRRKRQADGRGANVNK